MRILGNILWHFPFFGFVTAAVYFIAGSLLTLTVILAPIGLGLIQYSKFLLWPYGYAMIKDPSPQETRNRTWETYSKIVMLLYIPIGAILVVVTAIQGVLLFLTIIGIPVALVLFNSLGTIFNPVGKKCVPVSLAQAIEINKANKKIDEINQAVRS